MEEKVSAIISILKERYGDAPCALHYQKDYELMIAVRLSAQCTDARVNLVTPALFAAYPTLEAMAEAGSFLWILQTQSKRHCSCLSDAAFRLRRKGPRHDGGTS